MNVLRKYDIPDVQIGDWKGQYGIEESPALYIEHTKLWVKEAWRVLRDDGIMFLNLGDTYGGSGGDHKEHHQNNSGFQGKLGHLKASPGNSNKTKCQLLIPHRVTIALVDAGWCLRNTIIWHKSNAMPESVTDRFSKKYEYVFMFTKSEKYCFDLDAVREKCQPLNRWGGNKLIAKGKSIWDEGTGQQTYRDREMQPNGGMKNPGDVWQIPTQPSGEKHYAMWPERLVERMIKCSTKPGDIILDPFAGSGTTLKVAKSLQRQAIGIDLGYHEISDRRLSNIQKRFI